jgi:hypothetical protein
LSQAQANGKDKGQRVQPAFAFEMFVSHEAIVIGYRLIYKSPNNLKEIKIENKLCSGYLCGTSKFKLI